MSASGPRILFAANIERGQCGVLLATVDALIRSHPGLDIHFASFSSLEAEVRAISDEVIRTKSDIKPIKFHDIEGQTYSEAIHARIAEKHGEGSSMPTPAFSRPLNAWTTMKIFLPANNGLFWQAQREIRRVSEISRT
ncbi:hypothetical protein G3M48_001603 [Beauveria asiatica]|uniref:Uncharacterized protein n=1 Tax=Beauveria asiatica TaxID=1069075 RepID=A0AAW0RZH3_9HYPO